MNLKSKLIISVFGLIMIVLGFTLGDIVIEIGYKNITNEFISIITIIAVALEYMALGVKIEEPIKTIKSYNNQQLITFSIATIVLIYAIFGLFGHMSLSGFTSGQLIVIGALTFIDVWRNN